MQALLTVVPVPNDRVRVMSEAHRLLLPRGKLYIAEFGQTWHIPKYRERYISGYKETGYESTFQVADEQDGSIAYYAHHFSIREIVELLLQTGFTILQLRYEFPGFQTRTGHVIDGMIVIAQAV
jgi:hypothetical protein